MPIVDAILKFLALWGLWICPAILLVSVWGITRLGRGQRLWIPSTWKARAGMACRPAVEPASEPAPSSPDG